MKTKKIFAWVTSVTLCFSMLTACGSVEEKAQTTDSAPAAAEQKELKAEETTQTTAPAAAANEQNDFQNDEINKLFDNNYDYKSDMVEGSECTIVYMRMYGNTASFNLRTDRDCTLIAAAYDQENVKMLSAAITKVSAGSKRAEVTFDGELPKDYFYMRAFLVDSETLRPLSRMRHDVMLSNNLDVPNKQSVDEYYEENATVISVGAVDETNMFTESEVIAFLKERGFDMPVKHDRSADGKIHLDEDAAPDSEERHPTYTATERNSDDILWEIYIIGKCIMAYPIDLNTQKGLDFAFVENKVITAYDSDTNRFFEIEPKEGSEIKIKVIDKIDSSNLSSLSMEDIKNI